MVPRTDGVQLGRIPMLRGQAHLRCFWPGSSPRGVPWALVCSSAVRDSANPRTPGANGNKGWAVPASAPAKVSGKQSFAPQQALILESMSRALVQPPVATSQGPSAPEHLSPHWLAGLICPYILVLEILVVNVISHRCICFVKSRNAKSVSHHLPVS